MASGCCFMSGRRNFLDGPALGPNRYNPLRAAPPQVGQLRLLAVPADAHSKLDCPWRVNPCEDRNGSGSSQFCLVHRNTARK